MLRPAMEIDNNLARYSHYQPAVALSGQVMHQAATADSESAFLRAVCPLLLAATGRQYVALTQGLRGRWRVVQAAGAAQTLPVELLAETLDRDEAVSNGPWSSAPLMQRAAQAELLLLHGGESSDQLQQVNAFAAVVGVALNSVRARIAAERRVHRLEAILEIAAQWQQTLEMDDLLMQMAETSTRLLQAQRASIFLWDKPNRILVGRPALGVEGNELRIPDDKGIVGQVVQTGEIRRVDQDIEGEQREIDRKTDKELGFETHSLLCIPLRKSNGELLGAFEMINKIEGNFTRNDETALTELAAHAAIALENTQQYGQLLQSRNQMAEEAASGVKLIGQCPPVQALRSTISRLAKTELAILILGENGTGKEVVSQLIHYLSNRKNEPFVAINCAALTESLLESELFGHEKGAFTDARDTRQGKFELASGGTLFLDEIGDMSLSAQAKLLRVLEDNIVVRVGGSTPIHTDVRVFAATNQNLGEMVRDKTFREDLFYRLNGVTLDLPPLRDRGDDIVLLAEHFLQDFCVKARRKTPKFTAAARKRLLRHNWPGNVRELRNLMERLAYLSQGDKVDADDLAFTLSPGAEAPSLLSIDLPLTDATRMFQTEYIKKHIDQARGNMTEAARRLGLHRSNLYRKMRQLEMENSEDETP